MDAVLDSPMALHPRGQGGRLCVVMAGGGDEVDHLHGLLPVLGWFGGRARETHRPQDRQGALARPNAYIKTWTGWAYLATVIDLHTRGLVGWAIADHMRTDLVIDALRMAVETKKPAPGVIFHSDRGSQYTSQQFVDFCAEHKIRRSVGRTGSCFDNAVAESFNATYKKELVHTRPWPSIGHLTRASRNWFIYYNLFRRHSTINYLTPFEKEVGWTKDRRTTPQ
ncbi:MAG: IS3 family transposase [Tetrasphaera sp.]